MYKNAITIFLLILLPVMSCSTDEEFQRTSILFERVASDHTNILFENQLAGSRHFNILNYRNFYNGGGVGIGDINNDGLQDIYFTANMRPNALYLNRGDFEFEEITEKAGVAGTKGWSTGVSMVDINADGWLDIYICNSGNTQRNNRRNELFINNGDGTFRERAAEYGLDHAGYSIHASFFDYDNDGDLDMYLLNNAPNPNLPAPDNIDPRTRERTYNDRYGGDKMMRNDNGYFTDVSGRAGIFSGLIAYGLGVSVSDLDRDGWQDIYISNDFFERDYLYLNNRDGTFREVLETHLHSISLASMGADIADLTGDGYPEIFVTEMLPGSEKRLKTNMVSISWDTYQNFYLKNGYHHQFTRNTLQHHKGVISGNKIAFSEIGRLSGLEATDWSWAANIMDLDNDGHKDLFVANGIYRDILNRDFLKYASQPRDEFLSRVGGRMRIDPLKVISGMPSNPIPNRTFSGTEGLFFADRTSEWGLDEPTYSNGAAYGDLDNDGYLDLVINNVNMPATIYRNRGREVYPENNYLKINLIGTGQNKKAIGTKVSLFADGEQFYLEQMPNRGYQSSVDDRLNFGLGPIERVDTLLVEWYSGKKTELADVDVNQILVIKEGQAAKPREDFESFHSERLEIELTDRVKMDYRHLENEFNDFRHDPLIFHMSSTEGPKIAVGDVNGDNRDDLYIGGAKGSPGVLFVQGPGEQFRNTNVELLTADNEAEDLGSCFVDVDGDGDLDLYVASGGSENRVNPSLLHDRLYLNDGAGNFTKSAQKLPANKSESTSVVKANDFDRDGDMDLFVGARGMPDLSGLPQNGHLLQNDGTGHFRNITEHAAPGLLRSGMITDAAWSDHDNDGDSDLIIVGRWMPVKVFENDGTGRFSEQTEASGLSGTSGWWNAIASADLDDDGDVDFVAGNLGLNSKFRASPERPMSNFINDFDRNGSVEQVITAYNGDRAYPLADRSVLTARLPFLKSRFPTNESYAGRTIDDIFSEEERSGAVILSIQTLESSLFLNNGDGTYIVRPLPLPAQVAPVYAILIHDIDTDKKKDLLLGGNLHAVKPEIGPYDASHGIYLKGLGGGDFQAIPENRSGLFLEGEIRDFAMINEETVQSRILVARNDDSLQVLTRFKNK